MDFEFNESEQAVAQLARQILDGHTTNELLKQHERSGDPFDAALWKALGDADLLGIAVPQEHGGSGLGFLALCLLLQEIGRAVAPVPAYAALVCGALPLARFSEDPLAHELLSKIALGTCIVTAGLSEPGTSDPFVPTTRVDGTGSGARLTGVKSAVPYAEQSTHVLVPAVDAAGTIGVFCVETSGDGVTLTPQPSSDGLPHAQVELDGAAAVLELSGADGATIVRWIVEHAIAARCMMQLGVTERALEMTGAYSRERIQFDRPIGSFQAVHQRAADAYIEVDAIRLTSWEAVWRLANELPASQHVMVAKYVAAEGGQFAAYACQHLHGGIGIDVDYPLHRYFKWATKIEHELGSARHQLDRLGREIALNGIQVL